MLVCNVWVLVFGDVFFFFGERQSLSAMAWSRSTSWDGGTCPSDPRPPRKPSRDAANARAAAHVMIAYNRGLYACSKRRCMNRALASNRMKIFAFSDHLPPTSRARTTSCALASGPTSSGLVRSLTRRASASATHRGLLHLSWVRRCLSKSTPAWYRLPVADR